jgi:predicted dehydrogenase
MADSSVRIGLIGAGKNTRDRHIPGFQAMDGVEVVSVCNRSRESSQRVADQFGIPKIFEDWQDLVEDDEIDAICIGTWPYLHCAMTLAGLENYKHVLTEARMAMNADEAHTMLDASKASPNLVTQIVPSPFTFAIDETVRSLVADGYIGDLIAIDMNMNSNQFPDSGSPLSWRHERELSGLNIMHMGIWYEALIRWVGPASDVMAMTSLSVPLRKNDEGDLVFITVPDHVDVICKMAIGGQARIRISSVIGLGQEPGIWINGSEGSLFIDGTGQTLTGGRRGDSELNEIPIAPEKRGNWRVEEEFVNAIRGLEKVKLTNFEDGVKYMEFTEAVTRSAQLQESVSLPL